MEVQLNEADVRAALESKLGRKDLELVSWEQKSLMEDGRLGYLGDHFMLEARVRLPCAAATDVTLFVKALPKNPTARKTCTTSGLFRKEALFYGLLSADMIAAMRQERPGFQPFVFPACHLIKDDCILLDDLSRSGFKGMGGRECMPIEHARLVVKALGELHAAGLVLEERAGGRTLVDQFPEINYETFFCPDPEHAMAKWHQASIKLCVAIVPHLDKYKGDSAAIAKAQAALPDLLRSLFDKFGAWPGVRNTLCHGDVWINNFMFRYDASGAPVETSLVDFQLARYTPPAHDLIMFIAFCTDRAFQKRYLDELTRLHYDSMAAALRRAGCDPDKVLPWSEFQDVAAKQWKYGLLMMALEQPFSLAPSSLMDPLLVDEKKFYQHCHVDRTDAIIKLYEEDAYFRSRYNETMEGIIDNYILNA
ncbi:putative oxidoreductase dhs-27 [Frankliniella fusca]|uniref:Oxidoreductase dhs-27 n=1 Tax=Frankliniella fusca TaxID=407009 RepID=A0AAE1LLC3_9NEOP|nr:putative oxidoreductase dhs-27 [Frankliniella fusca]